MENLKKLGFKITETPWKETLWQLKNENFFLCYNEKTKEVELSETESDYSFFNSVTINNVSIAKLQTLISILKNEG